MTVISLPTNVRIPYGTEIGEANPYQKATSRYISGSSSFWEFKEEVDTIDSFGHSTLGGLPPVQQPSLMERQMQENRKFLAEKRKLEEKWHEMHSAPRNIILADGGRESILSRPLDQLVPIEAIQPRYPLSPGDVRTEVVNGRETACWNNDSLLSQFSVNEIRAYMGFPPDPHSSPFTRPQMDRV